MSRPAIEVRSLLVRYGRRNILQIEDFTVHDGQVVTILGPNGAGKSTLLKCLLGFVSPTTGSVNVLGIRPTVRVGTSLSRLRRRIGYVPQILAAHSETPLTVREVVAIGRTGIAGLFRRLTQNDWQIVDHWLKTLGLAGLSQRAYSSLSGGEQRKTLIAKAMVQQPEILILDEPTANLDLFWREQIVAVLQNLHEELGLTIVLVCHELEVIPSCTGRLLVLQDGLAIADGSPENVLTCRLVETLYGSRLRLVTADGRYAAVPVGGSQRD
jgi:ABC-type cobalamin/Fe3+-siderophores transport system ATPase subunit